MNCLIYSDGSEDTSIRENWCKIPAKRVWMCCRVNTQLLSRWHNQIIECELIWPSLTQPFLRNASPLAPVWCPLNLSNMGRIAAFPSRACARFHKRPWSRAASRRRKRSNHVQASVGVTIKSSLTRRCT